jgi:cell pole-organizing protein PopZ
MRQVGEPSVEEILESIKKVIARDNRAGPGNQARQDRGNVLRAPEEHEVLDLSEFDEDDTPMDPEPLIADQAVSSMRESLAALATISTPGAAPQIVRSGETSLEGLVRDMLRPMLADWLDKNLPPMVERLVATEISRIVGKKG